jgi:hypothetical protein
MRLTFAQQVLFARDALEVFISCQGRVNPSLVQRAMEEVVYFAVRIYYFQHLNFVFLTTYQATFHNHIEFFDSQDFLEIVPVAFACVRNYLRQHPSIPVPPMWYQLARLNAALHATILDDPIQY